MNASLVLRLLLALSLLLVFAVDLCSAMASSEDRLQNTMAQGATSLAHVQQLVRAALKAQK